MSPRILRPALLASALAMAALGCERSPSGQEAAPAPAQAPASSPATAAEADGPESELLMRARALFKAVPDSAPELPGNPLSDEKIALGKMLYFDGRLSSSGVISCNSCHNLGMGGIDGVPTSIGHGFAKGPRNAPTVYNAVFNVAQFWDGRAVDLKEQAMGPVQAAVEMNAKPDEVVATLRSMPGYVDAFKAAFPGDGDAITFENMAAAIEAFEATLVTPGAPFDEFLAGKADALSAGQQEGLRLFMDKGCSACHAGVNFGGQAYYPFGVFNKPDGAVRPEGDLGRFGVTESKTDEYVFRAAPLRNIALTAPYFHSGAVWSLRDAVRIMGDSQLGATLSEDEVDKIHEFLLSLTGRMPQVEYPQLPQRSDATPPPPGY
ncbi:cytochrome-c peroxidase [Luteimonas sp. e5]